MSDLTQRIFTNWGWQRGLYLLVGVLVLASALADFYWLGIIAGGYFTAMAVFGFGCAAGNCAVPSPEKNETQNGNI